MIKVREYSTYIFIFGLFLKLTKSTFYEKKKDLLLADGAGFRVQFCFNDTINFASLLFFLSGRQ